MAGDALEISEYLPASPRRIYLAWLDGAEHTAMTGAAATVDARIGGRFTAWDGYIEGLIVAMEPHQRLLFTWRTSDFPPSSEDSHLEVLLEPEGDGTRLTLFHTGLPAGQAAEYTQGWVEYYVKPMRRYFGVVNESSGSSAQADAVRQEGTTSGV